jgi:hypothetical protein
LSPSSAEDGSENLNGNILLTAELAILITRKASMKPGTETSRSSYVSEVRTSSGICRKTSGLEITKQIAELLSDFEE